MDNRILFHLNSEATLYLMNLWLEANVEADIHISTSHSGITTVFVNCEKVTADLLTSKITEVHDSSFSNREGA